ncbi:hypothetical protein like AT2G38430 [Hibiscus trionum]|uniref:DUF7903 domain-containing protein n=1 Tax=Hibiscus trionum TaxID=183268 RepID=A0A9W7HKL6_HIBTR|nr:hypothetical protein like AT2G38430 [Hibiscus trionum]
MAYIPPHKRHLKDSERPMLMPTPIPASLTPRFNRNVGLRALRSNADWIGWKFYSNLATTRWFAVGWNDENGDASASHLKPVSVEPFEWRTGEKPLILVKHNLDHSVEAQRSSCASIVENVLPDLLSSFQEARAEIDRRICKDGKLTMVARFGNILFQGRPSVNLESVTEDCLSKLKRTFHTTVSASYAANIIAEVASKIGLDFADVKDSYLVKLSDSTQPYSTIFCKCRVNDGKKLQLYKIELNPVRDMVIDISCLHTDLDLRLALSHRRILTSIPEDDMCCIRYLIDSAVVDPDVEGGLRWPFGKASGGNRFNVIGMWHTKATAYANASVRLKVQHADRFDFITTYAEASNEVFLKLKGIVSGLLDQNVEINAISDMLKDNLVLIWRHFLRCEPF